MKMKMKMKNGSHSYDINKPSSSRGCKYNKYKRCLTMMTLTHIKQHMKQRSNEATYEAHFMKNQATLRLSGKKMLLIKKACKKKSSPQLTFICSKPQ